MSFVVEEGEMGKTRVDRSQSAPDARFESPFARLAGLQGALPVGQGNAPVEPPAAAEGDEARALAGKLIIRRERAGRGGKAVTILEGVQLGDEGLEAFATELKKALGCGAGIEGGRVVLQGEQEKRLKRYLEERGARRVVLGSVGAGGGRAGTP